MVKLNCGATSPVSSFMLPSSYGEYGRGRQLSALVILIIFNFVFALLTALVGHFRSGNGSMGFFLGMVVGPFGLMMVAFSPEYRRGAPSGEPPLHYWGKEHRAIAES